MDDELYNTVKEIYTSKLGIPEDAVDLMADYEVIKLSVAGLSNEKISLQLDIPKDIVGDILRSYFREFSGWEHSLDINPLFVYSSLENKLERDPSLEEFTDSVLEVSVLVEESDIKKAYSILKSYLEIEMYLKKEWR